MSSLYLVFAVLMLCVNGVFRSSIIWEEEEHKYVIMLCVDI